jgi:hypothetical protein
MGDAVIVRLMVLTSSVGHFLPGEAKNDLQFVLIVTAGVRSTPSVLMIPLEQEFGWRRSAGLAAVAIGFLDDMIQS